MRRSPSEEKSEKRGPFPRFPVSPIPRFQRFAHSIAIILRRHVIVPLLCGLLPLAGGGFAAASEATRLYRQAEEALWQNRLEVAQRLAEELRQYFPRTSEGKEALYLLARIAEQRQQPEIALRWYQAYLKSKPFSVHRQTAAVRIRLIRTAIKRRAAPVLRPFLKALNLRERGKFAEAIAVCDSLIENFPRSYLADDARHLIAFIYLTDMGDYPRAIRNYERLLKEYPRSNYLDNAYYGLGIALEKIGQFDRARKMFQTVKDRHTAIKLPLGQVSFPKDNYFSRLWFRKAEQQLEMLAVRRAVYAQKETLLQEQPFVLGMGDRLVVDQPVGSGQTYRAMWHLVSENGFRPQLLLHWITRNTDWRWETPQRLQACHRAGYTPVIAFWYFGDDISPEFVQQHREEYFQVIEKQLIPLIRDLPEVWILLEPEFNKNGMLKWKGWDAVAVEAIERIHRGVPGARVGLAIGDWGDYEVQPLKESIAEAAAASDFLGMVEMMSYVDVQNSFDPGWEPVERIHRFAAYLQQTFGKPLLVAYMALSTAGGWEEQQARIIRRFFSEVPYLMHWEVMGACFFSLFDDPQHEGWFSSAEQHFGLLTAEGQPKPGAAAWREGETWLTEQDRTPPGLKTPLRLKPVQVDFSAGERLEGEARLSEWCRWNIEVIGKQSRARRTFSGAGERVFFSWKGLAEKGTFLPEVCLVRLTAYDRAGHPLVKTAHTTCLILATPSSKMLSRTVPQPDVNLFLWGRNSRLLRPRYRGMGFMNRVEVMLSEPPSGVVLIPNETAISARRGRSLSSFPGTTSRKTAALDLSSGRDGGYLILNLTPSTSLEGLLVGLTDREGTQSEVMLEAYTTPEKSSGEWRRVIIPLADFPALGLRSQEGIAPEWHPFDWRQVTRLTLISTVMPVRFALGEVTFLTIRSSPRQNRH